MLKDKYFLLCFAVCFVLIVFSINYSEHTKENEMNIGIVTMISESSSGYIVDMEDENGIIIHCYSKIKLSKNIVYSFSGYYSKDNSIFFIESIDVLQSLNNIQLISDYVCSCR